MDDLVMYIVGSVIAAAMIWGAKSLSDLTARVAAIQERLTAGADEMDRLEGRVDDHETRIRGLEQGRK